MEPDWTKSIPNYAICNWYYVLFCINIVLFAILLLFIGSLVFVKGVSKPHIVGKLFMYTFTGLIAGTNALFFYLMCDRALTPSS